MRRSIAGRMPLEARKRPELAARLIGHPGEEVGRQLGERFEAGERMSPKELGVIAGISVDKVSMAEGWSRQWAENAGAWIAAIAEKLQPVESVDARLEVTRSPGGD